MKNLETLLMEPEELERMHSIIKEFVLQRISHILIDGFDDVKKRIKHKTDSVTQRKEVQTHYDRILSDMAIDFLSSNFPGIEIISEENIPENTGAKIKFVVDPIDGTKDFISGRPHFQFGLGLVVNNKTEYCITYNPIGGLLFHAIKGRGAYCNGERIHVSKRELYNSHVYMRTSNRKLMKPLYAKLFDMNVGAIKDDVSTHFQMTQVARGVADGHINQIHMKEGIPPSWDFCQYLLIEEAGGRVTDWEGNEFDLSKNYMVASNGYIHDELLRAIPKPIKNPNKVSSLGLLITKFNLF